MAKQRLAGELDVKGCDEPAERTEHGSNDAEDQALDDHHLRYLPTGHSDRTEQAERAPLLQDVHRHGVGDAEAANHEAEKKDRLQRGDDPTNGKIDELPELFSLPRH